MLTVKAAAQRLGVGSLEDDSVVAGHTLLIEDRDGVTRCERLAQLRRLLVLAGAARADPARRAPAPPVR